MEIKQTLENKNASEKMRVVRGYAIISKGDVPKKINEKNYSIPSQNGNGEYIITKGSKWKCTCPDYESRKKDCKHIHAVKFYLDFNKKVKVENRGIVKQKPKCPYCNCEETIGYGKRHGNNSKQKYFCKGCKRQFIEEKDFERYKGNGKITTLILDLYFKGISLRGIQDHLKQFYDLSLDHSNILRRIQKYSAIINEYVKTLKPEVSNIWHIDEMKIQADGKWKWLWNIMDEDTKFLITNKVTSKRKIRDCRNLLKDAREMAQKQPEFMITDGCHSYNRSIPKEMPETSQIRLTSIRDKRTNNNIIERLNGTNRDRFKTMRGFDNEESASIMTTAFGNYYNFIKIHSTIETTPAIKSGINAVNLNGNRWMQLLEKSFE